MRPLRALSVASVAAATLVTALATPASAAPSPTGSLCGFASADAPVAGTQNGVLFGGPVVLGDDTNPAVVYSGTLTCTFQAGRLNGSHSDADTCSASSPLATGVATLAAPNVLCSFALASDDYGHVCTQVDIVGGPTLYWASGVGGPGEWTTDPSANCTPTSFTVVNTDIVSPVKAILDAVLCPLLAPFFPPDGDVGIFYDCPPYSGGGLFPIYVVLLSEPEIAA